MPHIISDSVKLRCSLDALLILKLPWVSVAAIPSRTSEHINLLEVRALLAYVRWLVQSVGHGRRIIVLVDSGADKGAVRKFRSSSKALNFFVAKKW